MWYTAVGLAHQGLLIKIGGLAEELFLKFKLTVTQSPFFYITSLELAVLIANFALLLKLFFYYYFTINI